MLSLLYGEGRVDLYEWHWACCGGVGGGCRAPVTGLDSMCKKPQLSDPWHTTHWKIKGQSFQTLPVLVFTKALMKNWGEKGQNEERFEISRRIARKKLLPMKYLRRAEAFVSRLSLALLLPFATLLQLNTTIIFTIIPVTLTTERLAACWFARTYTHPQPLTCKHRLLTLTLDYHCMTERGNGQQHEPLR